jgi:hypothetical protein
MICFLCCYRKEAAQHSADTKNSGTQGTFSGSSPEEKQKQNPKVSIKEHVYKKQILRVSTVFKHLCEVYYDMLTSTEGLDKLSTIK